MGGDLGIWSEACIMAMVPEQGVLMEDDSSYDVAPPVSLEEGAQRE